MQFAGSTKTREEASNSKKAHIGAVEKQGRDTGMHNSVCIACYMNMFVSYWNAEPPTSHSGTSITYGIILTPTMYMYMYP